MIGKAVTRNAANNNMEAAMAEYLRCPDKQHLQWVVRAGSRLVHHFANLYAPGGSNEDVAQGGRVAVL
ncbi:hypothetical protein ABDB91_10645 [Desulfoscipio sp. XC116]|uniref:hypothetical protein n=1 Tax=Desulfoscipio sp. XC116 TaxID=3144975 RepID=UPI00325BC23B